MKKKRSLSHTRTLAEAFKCNLAFNKWKKLEDAASSFFVCEACQLITCNGSYDEFKSCKLKDYIANREKELKVYKNFFKIRKMKKQYNGDVL